MVAWLLEKAMKKMQFDLGKIATQGSECDLHSKMEADEPLQHLTKLKPGIGNSIKFAFLCVMHVSR